MASSAIGLLLMALAGLFVSTSFAQENMTSSAANETRTMVGNQTNQTGGENETQQGGPLEQLGKIFGGGQ